MRMRRRGSRIHSLLGVDFRTWEEILFLFVFFC